MNLEVFVCTDTETTGLDSNKNEILEVCAIKFNKAGEILGKFYQLCSPMSGEIPEAASNVNGITMEKVAGMPFYLKDQVREKLADFIGECTLIGHNLIGFDSKFLKINPKKMEDTLLMARKMYPRQKNRLQDACKREGIKFNPEEAHSAEYDVLKTIELYLRLKGINIEVQMNMFDKGNQVNFKPTQAYSYSRLNLYKTCPFKWHKQYVECVQEPGYPYFTIGRICHTVAELSALWCYIESFVNKFDAYVKKVGKISASDESKEALINDVKKWSGDDKITRKKIGRYLYNFPSKIREHTKFSGLPELLNEFSEHLNEDDYELPTMPDLETYQEFVQKAKNKEKCDDPAVAKDCEYILNGFYARKDFSLQTGELALAERKLAFNKDWKLLKDWMDGDVFFRGILDLIEYLGDTVAITDYKTSRKMLTSDELKNDMQFKIYILLISHFLPEGAIKRLIIRHDYMRYNKVVEAEVMDYKQVVKEAKSWINDTISEIEEKLIIGPDEFKPNRNQFCGNCFLANENICPLFSKKFINNIDDPETFAVHDVDDCRTAWKRVEANKAEIANLSKKCKDYLKTNDSTVDIDENAKLDFWVEKTEKYNSYDLIKVLIKKKVKITDFMGFFGMTKSNFEKMVNKLKLDFSEEEKKLFISESQKSSFDANTKEEAEEKGYLNI